MTRSRRQRITAWVDSACRSLQKTLSGHAARRRGASLILILAMLSTFVITAAITIDYAFMCLVQTELRVATDAAAIAGAEALFRLEEASVARAAAVEYAALNTVAGVALQLAEQDVSVGHLSWGGDGRWNFVADRSPLNAVRVHSRTGGEALHPAIPLFFGRVLGRDSFTPSCTAIAAQEEIVVCLCLDRSASMLYDMSGLANSYPDGNPQLSSYRDGGVIYRYSVSPPHPTASRWAVLGSALDCYFEEVAQANAPPRTGLVTWASDKWLGPPVYAQYEEATVDVAVPARGQGNWNSNVAHLNNELRRMGRLPLAGDTNLSAGLDKAVEALGAPEVGASSTKVIILLTDGLWNEGRHPREAAIAACNAGIVVHTITMLTDFQADVEEVAQLTGGRHFWTQDEEELRQAFRELARWSPIVLVQ